VSEHQPLYRIFKWKYLSADMKGGTLSLPKPCLWDDPFENVLPLCQITDTRRMPWQCTPLDGLRRPMFAQCWSVLDESDALWRIYSSPAAEKASIGDAEGLKIRTTAGKLLGAVRSVGADGNWFLGRVRYLAEAHLTQFFADEVGRRLIDAFSGADGHARSLLIKREAFFHEKEARLIYVDMDGSFDAKKLLPVTVDWNQLADEIILDPRVNNIGQRVEEVRALDYRGPVSRSDLYRRRGFEIVIQQASRGQ
jgi:hypothetical protein